MDKKTYNKLKKLEKSDSRLTVREGKATDPSNLGGLIKEINKTIKAKEKNNEKSI